MNQVLSIDWTLIGTVWYYVNGILHDIFVIKNHKGSYDRDLLRLLMDGHVLMLSGALLAVCFLMMRNQVQYSSWIAIITGIGMLVYCFMIFPFLKSFVTMFISLMVVLVAI